jgi:transcriptional regulator with XRE-family HTH domain
MSQSKPVTEVLAAAIRRARDDRGWSAQELADRCAEAGMPSLDRSAIANIERGRRQRIGVDEWLALAYVLGIPPVAMLVEFKGSPKAEISPNTVVGTEQALRWLLGEMPPPVPGGGVRDVAAWSSAGLPLFSWREVWDKVDEFNELHEEMTRASRHRRIDDPALLEQIERVQQRERERITSLQRKVLEEISERLAEMAKEGLIRPKLGTHILADMDRLDVPRPTTEDTP